MTKIVQYTFSLVSTAVFSMLDKLLLTSVTDGIVIKITVENSRNEDCMQKHLYDHYLSCNNDFLNMVSVTFIDKTDPSNPLEREQYWRHILQSNAPHRLNIADSV